MIESKIVYFEEPGKQNTEEVLRLAKQRAAELGIKTIKVACEIASMAAYSGLVRTDEEVISIAGTNLGLDKTARGADTEIVIQPANVNRFFQTQVKEIICKPRNL